MTEEKNDQPLGGSTSPSSTSPGVEKFNEQMRPRSDRSGDPEQELWRGGYSAKDMVGQYMLMGLVSLVIVGGVIGLGSLQWVSGGTPWWIAAGVILLLWIGVVGKLYWKKLSVDYRLTSQWFIHKQGVLRRTTDRIEVIHIDDVTFDQGIIQRMLGVGKITIHSSDATTPQLELEGIDNAAEVFTKINNAMRKERIERGVTVKAV